MECPRILREKKSIKIMIEMYCRGKHGTPAGLCGACNELLEYAWQRLEHCKFGEQKPNCSRCPIHCYRPDMREKIIAVMRYSGPRMIFKQPLEVMRHLLRK